MLQLLKILKQGDDDDEENIFFINVDSSLFSSEF
jgi:hypothetical protein